jgi:hypothetical protein
MSAKVVVTAKNGAALRVDVTLTRASSTTR